MFGGRFHRGGFVERAFFVCWIPAELLAGILTGLLKESYTTPWRRHNDIFLRNLEPKYCDCALREKTACLTGDLG